MKPDEFLNFDSFKVNSFDVKDIIKPVIYFLCDSTGEIVYVGKSVNGFSRIFEHKRRIPFSLIVTLDCDSESLTETEEMFIKKVKPRYNVQGNKAKHLDK